MSKTRDKQKELLISQLSSTPIVQVACEKLGIGRSTYYRWRKEDEEFCEKADEALLKGRSLINEMAESQLISAIREKNITAIIFWLKNNHKVYKNKLEISGELETRNKPLSEEQKKLVEQALELANFNHPNPKNNE